MDPASSHTPAAAGRERRGGKHRSGSRAVNLSHTHTHTHTHACYWCVRACCDICVCVFVVRLVASGGSFQFTEHLNAELKLIASRLKHTKYSGAMRVLRLALSAQQVTHTDSHIYSHTHTLSHTYTHTHTHTHIYILTHTLSHTHTLSLTHTYSHTHILTHTHTHTHIYTLTHTYTHTYSLSHTHTHTYSHTHTYIHTHILSHTYIHTHILSHTYIHTHILSHTYIHTHILSHTYSHTHTYSLTLSNALLCASLAGSQCGRDDAVFGRTGGVCSSSESSGALTGTNTLRSVFNKVGVNIDLWFVCFNQNSGWPLILKVLNSCSILNI